MHRFVRTLAGLLVVGLLVAPLGDDTAISADPPARTVTAAELWLPPLGAPLQISRFYDLPHGPYRAGHRGIDLPAHADQPVYSPATGVVSFVGYVVDRPVISIQVDERTVISLEPVASELPPTSRVLRGDVIGTVAASGHCTTPCLHLGVRVQGQYVNPLRFLRLRAELVAWQEFG